MATLLQCFYENLTCKKWDLRSFHLLDTCPSLDQCRITFNNRGDVIFGGRKICMAYNFKFLKYLNQIWESYKIMSDHVHLICYFAVRHAISSEGMGQFESSFKTIDAMNFQPIGNICVRAWYTVVYMCTS